MENRGTRTSDRKSPARIVLGLVTAALLLHPLSIAVPMYLLGAQRLDSVATVSVLERFYATEVWLVRTEHPSMRWLREPYDQYVYFWQKLGVQHRSPETAQSR